MLVSLEETKQYLRVDGTYDDDLITNLMGTAQELCLSILRKSETDITEELPQLKTAIYYAASYLYEHREEADHHELVLTLRSLLSGLRQEAF